MRNFFYCLALGVMLISCKEEKVSYLTWSIRAETYPDIRVKEKEESLAGSDFPIAGTVSHHLLAGVYIDAWFKALAKNRNVKTFLIVSPQHWDLATGPWAMTDGEWKTAKGPVKSDQALLADLKEGLGTELQRELFHYEHGVSTLMPFIKRYFPRARVLPIAIPGEPPVNIPQVDTLTRNILPLLTKDIFLIISTDFSHHGGIKETLNKDSLSRRFLENPHPENWILTGCDNRPGIYLMSRLMKKSSSPELRILYNTNSYEISGEGSKDITSYFFSFLTVPRSR
jgi:MEMO1 family protein